MDRVNLTPGFNESLRERAFARVGLTLGLVLIPMTCKATEQSALAAPAFVAAAALGAVVGLVPLWMWVKRARLSRNRRLTERALRESETRLRNLSNHLPVAVFQYRNDDSGGGGFAYVSEGILPLLGFSPAELCEQPARLLDSIHPDDRTGIRWLGGGAALSAADLEWIGRSNPETGLPRWLQIRAATEIASDGSRAISGVIQDITQLKGVQQALESSRSELRELAAHREERVEQERQRLAREFHDELGQLLTSARMQLQMLDRSLEADPTGAHEKARDIDAMLGDAYRSVKAIASDLRPAALDLGLTAAVEWLAHRVLGAAGVRYTINFSAEADTLDEREAIALFRVIQESMTNIVRHAGARSVQVNFERAENGCILEVSDDGKGFNLEKVDRRARFGLMGISERAKALGGELTISLRPEGGTRLLLSIPILHRNSSAP